MLNRICKDVIYYISISKAKRNISNAVLLFQYIVNI